MNKIDMNIEKILSHKKIDKEYEIIKEMEDTITEIYKKNSDNDILDNLSLLYEVEEKNKYNINLFNKLDLDKFKLEETILQHKENIVMTGSYIRSVLLEEYNDIKQEIFISSITDINWKDILPESYEETETMFLKKVNNNYIYILKNKFMSVSSIILNGKYLIRFGYYNNKYYASPMFILEYNMNIKYMKCEQKDPVFKTKLDLFENYNYITDKKEDIFDIIDKKDYTLLVNLTSYDLTKLKDKLTCIEYAINLYYNEECHIISHQLKLIILELHKHIVFKRHPAFYAEILNLSKIDEGLFTILINNEYTEMKQQLTPYKNIDELNNSLLEYYIKTDKAKELYDYIKFICHKIDADVVNNIIKYKPENIIIKGINKNYLSNYNLYKIILLTSELNYIKYIKFNIEIAINFIDKIIDNCLIKSFFYIYKQSPNIINILDTNNNNILHRITENNDYVDMIKLLISLDSSLLSKKNKDGDTPLIYHAKNNRNICSILIEVIKNNKFKNNFMVQNNNGDNVIHVLSNNNSNLKLIKDIIFDNSELLNETNNDNYTPSIISTINNCEDVFYLYNSLKADLNIKDKYGNTCYHYICLNSMCIGMAIKNDKNIYGYTPKDYCRISHSYYHFIDDV